MRARIDPAHREGQRRQRQRQRAADMAGAEEIDRRDDLAEAFAGFAVFLSAIIQPSRDAAVGRWLRQRDEGPGMLGGAQRRQ